MGISFLSQLLSGMVESRPDILQGKRGGGVGYVVKDKRSSMEQFKGTKI
jgi:hypothetical protein